MTGGRETRERRTWRAGTRRAWEMGKGKWGDDSTEEKKKGSKTNGGRAEEGE